MQPRRITPAIGRILVPVDFSPCSYAALEYAVYLADEMAGEVEVLYVCEPPLYVTPEMIVSFPGQPSLTLREFARSQVGKEMDQMLASVERRGLSVRGRIDFGLVTDTIVGRAAQGYDLIVMGTHGRTGFSHALMGSVAEKVVRLARCPVLTVHADGRARERAMVAQADAVRA